MAQNRAGASLGRINQRGRYPASITSPQRHPRESNATARLIRSAQAKISAKRSRHGVDGSEVVSRSDLDVFSLYLGISGLIAVGEGMVCS